MSLVLVPGAIGPCGGPLYNISPAGAQPLSTNFYTSMSPDDSVDADGAWWEGEFAMLVKYGGASHVCWRRGLIKGTFPASTSWETMHNAYAITLQDAPGSTVLSVRIHNTGDGLNVKAGCDNFVLQGTHISIARDDAIQNDFGCAGTVADCLVDGCYAGYSSRPYDPSVPDNSGKSVEFGYNLMRLQDMPTTFLNNGLPGHARFWKMDNNKQAGWPGHPRDPKLFCHDNIFRLDTMHVCCGDFMIPPFDRSLGSVDPDYADVNNIVVWGGAGAFPYASQLRAGWTLTTDVSVWDTAKATWLAAHPGVTAQVYPFP